MEWIFFLGGMFVFTSFGAYLGVAMGTTGLIMLHYLADGAEAMAGISVWNYLNSYSLSALPIFIFMGELLAHSGLTQRMYGSLGPLFERVPGKLLHSNVVICSLFGAISGSSMANAAAVGSVVYPELAGRNYNKRAIAGSIAGSGTLGLLIPPSMALICYGAWMDVSVGKLFMAGILPGVMMALLFMAYIAGISMIRPDLAPSSNAPAIRFWPAVKRTVDIWPIGILIFSIMGSIYFGLATPTESAGMGAVTALIMGFFMGELNLRRVWTALHETARISGLIGLTLSGAAVLAQAVMIMGLPRDLVMLVGESGLSPTLILILVYALYLILGCIFECVAMMVMTLPFTFPIITGLGYDPVWYGVVTVMVTEIAQITPPVGANLYVIEGITKGEVRIGEVAIGCIPYWLLLMLGLILITLFPDICLWIPTHSS